jgi:tetratricopeptide (TPR) repeat protein
MKSPSSGEALKMKKILFKTISILLPFLILFLFEMFLRVFHYGNGFHLFIEDPENKKYFVFNPEASKKYFTNQAMATKGNRELFKKKKDAKTLRFFVLGESTTIGYPYFHNGSFHRWLQYRLIHDYPEQNFEIINLSLTAVNSYTVLGFAKELINYSPDAVLIYVGHNEYYGALGVASTEKIAGNYFLVNMILKLRELRLTQLLTSIYIHIAGRQTSGTAGTRMKMMVANEEISYNSKLYNRGIEQFRSNIDKTLSLFNKSKIPVFISNLVSNEKDFKPFVSIPVDTVRFPEFNKYFKLGLEAFDKNDFRTAFQFLLKADKTFDSSSLCNFYLGETVYKLGDIEQAKEYFVKAKDFDGLRFRAPEELNSVIKQLSDRYPNVYMVDTKTEFENWSDNHIIGNNLILEHVHPNLTGYALMSDVFYVRMKKENLLPMKQGNDLTFKQLIQEMPVSKVDSLVGIYTVSNLRKSWPFTDALQQDNLTVSTVEEKLAWSLVTRKTNWENATDSLFDYYMNSNQTFNARKTMEALTLEHPQNELINEKAGILSSNLKDYEKASFYFKKAFDLSPSFDNAKYLLANYLKLDKPVEAIPYLNYAIENNKSGLNLSIIKTYIEEIIQLKILFGKDSTNLDVINKIASVYLKMGNKEGSMKYVNKALQVNARNIEALAILAQLKNINQ